MYKDYSQYFGRFRSVEADFKSFLATWFYVEY